MTKYGVSEAKSTVGFKTYAVRDIAHTAKKSVKGLLLRGAVFVSAFSLVVSGFAPVNVQTASAHHDPFNGVEQTSVMLCHSGNGKNYTDNSPNVSGTGANVNLAGHEGHDFDIIPPFHYAGGVYNGKNWDDKTEDIWNGNGEGNGLCTGDGIVDEGPTTGSITIIKNTENAANNDTFTFTVAGETTVPNQQITTVAGTGSVTINNLLPGPYSLGETLIPTDWALINQDSTCDEGVTVVAGETATCTFVNNYAPQTPKGSLQIVKNTTDGDGTFSFEVSNITDGGSWTEVVTTEGGNGSITITGLDAGDMYGVVEVDLPDGWSETSQDNCDDVIIVANETITCTYENDFTPTTPEKGSLQVTKIAVNNDGTFGFTADNGIGAFEISTVDGTGSTTFTDLTPNFYVITEDELPEGWTQTSNTCDDNDGGITVKAGEQASCVITNTYERGSEELYSLGGRVYHDNNSQNGELDEGEQGLDDWIVNLYRVGDGEVFVSSDTTVDGGFYEFTDLPAGCYIVREAVKAGWDQTDPTVIDDEEDGVENDFEYEVSLGGESCGGILEDVINFLIKTADASTTKTTGLNFGNVEEPTRGGGGSSSSGSRDNDDEGEVLGESTGLPYQAPQVLGESTTELPRTGTPVALAFSFIGILAIIMVPRLAKVKVQ